MMNVANVDEFEFSEENLSQIEKVFSKYPKENRQSALLPVLDIAQRQNGWISKQVVKKVADLIGITPVEVQEVVSFYTMYHQKPVGKFHIQLCSNISCKINHSEMVYLACKDFLGISYGEITTDGMFSLEEVECLGACANAPAMRINDDYYEDLTYDATLGIIEDLRDGKTPDTGSQIGRKSSEPIDYEHVCVKGDA
jgi:NADH-quinone oxidoreductase subunit E/NADH dehydrogenase (ubiquinone) flavoprotein 2